MGECVHGSSCALLPGVGGVYVTGTFSCHLPPFLYFSAGPPLGGAQTMGKNTEQRPQPGTGLKHVASRSRVNHTTTQLWSQSMVE